MPQKYILLAFLIFFSHFTQGQNKWLARRVERIDSLLLHYWHNYDQAENEANELYDLLTTKYTTKEYKDAKIQVMLQRGFLVSLKGDFSTALQMGLEALEEAEEYKLPEKIYNSCLFIAIVYEVGEDMRLCKQYLDKAYATYKQNKLENIYSVYCIRMASYYRLIKKRDSTAYYAQKALEYATKYHNIREERDAYLLLGANLPDSLYRKLIGYKSMAAKKFLEVKDFGSAAGQFSGIAAILLRHGHNTEALVYSDSAIFMMKSSIAYITPSVYQVRSDIFEALGNIDSAHYYYKKYHNSYVEENKKMETAEIKKITEQYQNDKKEAVIKNQNQQMIFVVSLLTVIAVAAVLLLRTNKKINSQNKIISKQVEELMKTLEQKQVLLSELAHRVKNNLQHVISILEIQKESVDFNNIEELIRGNQNRIHSMALLHKKLNISESVNEVDLKKYIVELSELVKESYDNHRKKINLNVDCDIEKMSIEKALPVGLIIVELVSNSMKHAFKRRSIGVIDIALTKEENKKNKLYYADNGIGFDFKKNNEKGLGMEIIKGLIEQLDASIESSQHGGFELTLSFK